jgi:ankyrin repeat protein
MEHNFEKSVSIAASFEDYIDYLKDVLQCSRAFDLKEQCFDMRVTGGQMESLYPLHAIMLSWGSIDCPSIKILKKFVHPSIIQEKTRKGLTLLHLGVMSQVNIEIIRFLLLLDPDASKIQSLSGQLPLHFSHDFEITKLLIASYPEGVKTVDSQGHTPLHFAVQKNRSTCVIRELVRVGLALHSDSDAAGGVLLKTFHISKAVFSPFSMIRNKLFSYIDGKGTQTKEGNICWEKYEICTTAIAASCGYHGGTFLHICILFEEDTRILTEVIRRLENRIDVVDASGRFPLVLACMRRNINQAVIKILIEKHPKAVVKADDFRKIALHYALENGRNFSEGTESIVHASICSIYVPNPDNNLLPFMIAGHNNLDLNTIYGLVSVDPSIIHRSINISDGK